MRLGTFNLENIFDRAKAFNQDTIAEGKVILDEFARLNKLFAKPTYSGADKKSILKRLDDLGVLKDDTAGEFARSESKHTSSDTGSGGRPAALCTGAEVINQQSGGK